MFVASIAHMSTITYTHTPSPHLPWNVLIKTGLQSDAGYKGKANSEGASGRSSDKGKENAIKAFVVGKRKAETSKQTHKKKALRGHFLSRLWDNKAQVDNGIEGGFLYCFVASSCSCVYIYVYV